MEQDFENTQAEAAQKKNVTIKFPKNWVRLTNANGEPYKITSKDGSKSWDAALCTIPTGTKSNGIDLSGYKFKTFASPWNAEDIASDRGTSVSVSADHDVNLFKFVEGEGGEEVRKEFKIDPWKLSSAVKASREEYKAKVSPAECAKAAQQAAAKTVQQGDGQSQAARL